MLKYLEKHKKLLVYSSLIIYWIFLLAATSLPAASVPSIGFIDKVNHLIAYFILAVLLFLTLLFQRKFNLSLLKIGLFTILICSLYGALDEIHQMFIPGRSAEFMDWLADFGGACAAVIIMSNIVKASNYVLEKKNN